MYILNNAHIDHRRETVQILDTQSNRIHWMDIMKYILIFVSISDAPQRILGIRRDWSLQEETWKLKWSEIWRWKCWRNLKTFRTATNSSGGPRVFSSCAKSYAGRSIAHNKLLHNMNCKKRHYSIFWPVLRYNASNWLEIIGEPDDSNDWNDWDDATDVSQFCHFQAK